MYRRLAQILVLLVFASAIYRAATQSITTDEAFSHNLFLAGSFSRLFNSYDAAHHVLYNILAKLSITIFGLSEFTLRLPALLGALLYLTAIWRLSHRLFAYGPLFLLLLALLALNPHVMDYMSAARGYGLALGLLLWALERALRLLECPNPRLLYQAALASAFSVSANLTLLVPCVGLALLLGLAVLADAHLSGNLPLRARFWRLVDGFFLPGAVTAFVILILPLTKANRSHFYFGAASVSESIQTLAEMSFLHHPPPAWLASLLPGPGFWYPLLKVGFATLTAAAAAACLWLGVRWKRLGGARACTPAQCFLLLTGGTLALSAGALAAAHHLLSVLYPYARTGLYFVPLVVFTAAALWKSTSGRRWFSVGSGAPLVCLSLLSLAQFLAMLQFDHYGEWRFDRSNKRIVQEIRALHARRPASTVRVGVSYLFEPSLNFYRRRYRLNWMAEVDRSNPDGEFDYYVLLAEDRPVIQKRGLKVVYSDPSAGVFLAVNPKIAGKSGGD